MRRKYFRTLVALVLAVSLCLVMAVPASAAALTSITAMPSDTTAGVSANYTIAFTTATSGNLTTVEMEFPAGFVLTGVGVDLGATDNIGDGAVGENLQVVTYTVDVPETIGADVAISIELTGIVNTQTAADDYVVAVTTNNDVPAIVDGPTDTAPFEIVADALNKYLVEPAAATQTAGTAFNVVITAADQHDNPLGTAYTTDGPYTWETTAVAAPDETAPEIGTLAVADFIDGVATKSVTLYKAETGVTLTATDNSSVAGTSDNITVEHIGLVAYLVEPDAATQTAGTAFSVNITAVSNFENVVDSDDVTLNAYAFGFTGPSDAPDGTAWDYPTSANFSAGIWTASVNLKCVEQVELTVTDNQTSPMSGISDDPVFVEGINLDSTIYNGSATVTVTLGDQSKDTQTSIRAMSNSTDPDLIIIVIPETGAETGIFQGTFELVNETPGTGQLYVEHGDNVTITYPTQSALEVDPLNVAVVDAVVPTITIVSPLDEASTSETKPVIAATLADVDSDINPATIEMTVGGDPVVHSYNGTSGVVSYTPIYNLPDGPYTVTVDGSDIAGNPAGQALWSFTVDTDLPTITILTPADGAYVDDNTPEISALLENGGSGIDEDTIVMKVNTVQVEITSYNGTSEVVSYTPSENLTDGLYTVTVDVSDFAANTAEQAEWSFTVDVTDPVIAIEAVTTPTRVDTQAISGTGDEINVDELTLTVNDAVVAITENITEGTWATTENVTLTEGENAVVVTITDLAGNEASDEDTIVLDTVAPEVTDAEADPDVIQTATATPVTFSANVTDDGGSGVASVSANLTAIGGEEVQAMNDTGDGIYEFTWTDLTVAGADTYELTIMATDDAGNTNDTVNITLQVITDADDPVIESTTVEYPLGDASARVGDDVVITAVVTDNTTEIESVTIDATDIGLGDAEELIPTETADTYSATLIVGAGATVGNKTLTITATDLANHTDTDNVTVVVVAALTAYNLDLVEGWNLISLPLIPDDDSINVILADISDNVSQVRTWVYVDGVIDEKIWAEGGAVGVLAEMEDGQGYWIQMTEANTLTIQGVELPPPPQALPYYILHEGWNLIGFKSVDPTPVEYYLGTAVTEGFEVMYGYDAAGVIYTRILPGDLEVPGDELQPGQGYWLAVSAEGIIYP